MAKHNFRKPVKAPEKKHHPVGAAGLHAPAPSGDDSAFIPPAAGGQAPTPPQGMPMSNASRMSGRYGAPPPVPGGGDGGGM